MYRILGLLALLVAAPTFAWQQQGDYRYSAVERVVVVGDVHGAHEELRNVLRKGRIIDAADRWIGGTAHLVSVGDLLDRGDDSRAVMDLLMRLQEEAAAAGGRVHVVLGNHEVMNLTGDLAYVTPGEYASYLDVAPDPEGSERPPGFHGHRMAFAPEGRYGAWLLDLPFAVVVNDTLFLHAGVSKATAGRSLEALNTESHASLRRLMDARSRLRSAGAIDPDDDNGEVQTLALALAEEPPEEPPDGEVVDEAVRTAARDFLVAIDGLPFLPRGPVWNRRNALCHPFYNQAVTEGALAELGADRLVIGHTPTVGRTVQSRFEAQVVLVDTGMNVAYYNGHPSAFEFGTSGERVHYTDLALESVQVLAQRTWARPYDMTDEEIEAFLREAEVIKIEDLPTGITKPQRLTLRRGEQQMRAVFKRFDSDPGIEPGRWSRRLDQSDRYMHDVVAYRLDRLLGFEMVPPVVIREVEGTEGAVQYWLEGAINERDRRNDGIPYQGICGQADQYNLMNIFDALIHNDDRTLANVLYTRADWRLWLIDHTRSFRSDSRIPRYLRQSPWEFTPQLIEMLESIDEAKLAPLGDLLSDRQLEGIERRAARLLKLARKAN